MGTSTATADKTQSKLWRHAGSWWALMNGQVDKDVFIHRLAADHTWQQTGAKVDSQLSNGDALADGDTLYVLSRRPAPGGTWLIRFTFDPATGSYQQSPGFPVLVTGAATETATIAKDSAGMLWAAYTAPDSGGVERVWVTHSAGSDSTWVAPFVLPVADTTVMPDDIAAVVALDGKIGVMWSNQGSGAFRFVTHQDGAPPSQWGPLETALAGSNMADDHINLKKATDGRLFAAVKTSTDLAGEPRIVLLVRGTDGTWSSHVHSTRGDGMTRPIVLLDESSRQVLLFAATSEGTGAQIFYKATSMDSPGFGPGQGDPFVTWPGTTLIDATSTKRPLDAASGVVVLTGDREGMRYYHGQLGGQLGDQPAGPGASPPVGDTTAPAVKVSRRTVSINRKRVGAVRVTCPASEPGGCIVAVGLRWHGKRIARKVIALAGGQSKRVRVKLSRKAFRALVKRRRLRVRAVVTARDAAGNRRRLVVRLKLKAPKARRYASRRPGSRRSRARRAQERASRTTASAFAMLASGGPSVETTAAPRGPKTSR